MPKLAEETSDKNNKDSEDSTAKMLADINK